MSESQVTLAPSAQQQQSDVEYRPVPGFPGYEVGDNGTVRSYKKRFGGTMLFPALLRPAMNEAGYEHVVLMLDGRAITRAVHRIVLEAFTGPCPEGMEGCHNDGNPSNNRRENLRWDTSRANIADKESHGTMLRGESLPSSKLTDLAVVDIRRRFLTTSRIELANEYGVTPDTITFAATGRRWPHVTEPVTANQRRKNFLPHEIAEIQRRRAAGETLKSIADAFGSTESTMSRAVKRVP